MNSWESLYHRAAGDYNSGNFKDSYDNYLKAANALLHKLSKEVTFTKDAVKSKPNNSTRLFQQLKSCVQKLEDILKTRTPNISSPRPSFTSDIATSILTNNPHPTYLPVIPFSPLTRQAINYAHNLATISQKVSVATQKSSENKDNIAPLRKLNEELRQQRTKLDQVNSQIQSIADVPLVHWDAEAFALQLTIIDSKLYSKVEFRKDLLSKDRKNSKAQACLDFHRYLTNSFAHQFIIYSEITRSSGNPPRSTSQTRENIIAHAVRIAYLLLNVHRNFNSFAALMKSLTSPEVRRIRRLWVNLPNRVTQILKELSLYVKNDNNYKVYNDALVQKVEDFLEVGQGMIVIPWMQPHYEEIKAITQSYSSGKSGDSSDVILSAPGARKLESIFSLLEKCQMNPPSDDDEEWRTGRKGSPLTSRGNHQIVLDGNAIALPTDLSLGLGCGDLGLHHWIVSRVFLTKQQLIDESIEIEPLADNEQLPCVENDYEEEEEEEEDDRASVGQYDLGSDDSGDNMGATTSTTKRNIATGSTSQINSHEISVENLAKLELTEMSSLTTMIESNETSSKSTINPSSEGTSKLHENTVNPYSIKPTEEEESITQIDSIKPESTDTNFGLTSTTTTATKTAAIAIPQSSQRTTTPLLSPASLLVAKNLNPNAQVFIPRSQSFSNSTSATVQGAIDALTKESTEMGETSNSRKSITGVGGNDEDEEEFVYPVAENKSEDEFVYPLQDDYDEFVYDVDTSNSVKANEEDKNNGFLDPQQETSLDKDDGESKADSGFDTDRKDTVTKNGENSSSPNMGVDKVFTVGESTDNSITIRLNNAIGKD